MRDKTIKWINAVLQNDELSSDEFLVNYFIANGLSIENAEKAISQRNEALKDAHYEVKL